MLSSSNNHIENSVCNCNMGTGQLLCPKGTEVCHYSSIYELQNARVPGCAWSRLPPLFSWSTLPGIWAAVIVLHLSQWKQYLAWTRHGVKRHLSCPPSSPSFPSSTIAPADNKAAAASTDPRYCFPIAAPGLSNSHLVHNALSANLVVSLP